MLRTNSNAYVDQVTFTRAVLIRTVDRFAICFDAAIVVPGSLQDLALANDGAVDVVDCDIIAIVEAAAGHNRRTARQPEQYDGADDN